MLKFIPKYKLYLSTGFMLILLASCAGTKSAASETWSLVKLLSTGERIDSAYETVEVRNCGYAEIKSTNCSAGTSNDLTVGMGVDIGSDVFSVSSQVSTGLGLGRDSGESLELKTPPEGYIYQYTINKEYRVIAGNVLMQSASGNEQTASYAFHASCTIHVSSPDIYSCVDQPPKTPTIESKPTASDNNTDSGITYNDSCSTAPNLQFPSNNAALNTLIPNLTVDASNERATETHIEITTSSNGSNWIDYWKLTGHQTYPWDIEPYENFLPATTYYWRAYYICGNGKSYSQVWSFTTGSNGVILPAPKVEAVSDFDSSIRIQWDSVYGAKGYIVLFGKQYQPQNIYYIQDTFLTQTIESGKVYTIKVSAYNDYAVGQSSSTQYP